MKTHSCCSSSHEAKEHSQNDSGSASQCCARHKDGSAKLILSAIALAAGFSISQFDVHFPFFPYSDPSWIAVFLCAGPIFSDAFKSFFRRGQINASMLVSIAMIASFSLQIMESLGFGVSESHHGSYIFVVGEIAFLMALGSWLEDRTLAKTAEGLGRISTLMPKIARIKRNGVIVEIPASEINVGDIICVNPDEMISADGIIVAGDTAVNQSNMTGESIPIDKRTGDSVLCGTLNVGSYIEICAKKRSDETVLSRLIELVKEAEGRRAPISRLANKWASYIVPAAIITAFIVSATAYWGLGTTWSVALIRGVTILVVFCPCAFVLATPTAISAAIGNAANSGVLVKSGGALEMLSKITAVFFDKTGTLTKGNIRVSSFKIIGADLAEKKLLAAVAALESRSQHPLARALQAYALEKTGGEPLPEPENSISEIGFGIKGKIDGKFFEIKKSDSKDGKTSSEVFVDGNLVAAISFEDELRETARETVRRLRKASYEVAMLSGDNAAAVGKTAENIGIKISYANLMPQGKVAIIRQAQSDGQKVCMVGDGVNDAPSLAASDVSIAVAGLKNDIAVESAQISILSPDLRRIPAMLEFSKSVMSTISANIIFSLAVSLCAIILSVFGLINPGIGALVHNVSSVCVVLNSARLLKSRKLSQ